MTSNSKPCKTSYDGSRADDVTEAELNLAAAVSGLPNAAALHEALMAYAMTGAEAVTGDSAEDIGETLLNSREFSTAMERAAEEAVEEADMSSAVESELEDHDFSDDLEKALRHHDFADEDTVNELDSRVDDLENELKDANHTLEGMDTAYGMLHDRLVAMEEARLGARLGRLAKHAAKTWPNTVAAAHRMGRGCKSGLLAMLRP